MSDMVSQAIFLCIILLGFQGQVVPFGNLLFIHASTNATDNHKYSLFSSQTFAISGVLVYHLAHSFWRENVPFDFERLRAPSQSQKGHFSRENEAQEMTPKLLALAKVCSVLGNIRDVSWHLSKRGNELEKR